MNDRLHRFLLNAGGLLLCKGAGLIISLLAVPLVVTQLGPSGFGIWAVCQTLIIWVQALDLGLGLGLQNQISQAVDDTKRACAARTAGALHTTMLVITALFALGFLAVMLTRQDVLRLFGPVISTDDAALGQALLIITGLAMAASLLAQTAMRTAAGLQLMGRVSAAQSMGGLVGLAVLACGPRIGLSPLVGIAVLALLPVLAQLAASMLLLRHPSRRWALPDRRWTRTDLRRLFSCGIWFFISQVAALVVFQTDVVIVSLHLGAVEAGGFQATARLFALVGIGQGLVLGALMPAVANAHAAGERAWIAGMYRHAVLGSLAMLPLVAILALGAPWVVESWTGSVELRPTSGLAWGLAASCATTLWANLHATFLNAVGSVRFPALLAIAQACLNLVSVLIAVRWWGATGVAWASAMCTIISSVPFLWLAWRRHAANLP
jgi:O-antigen/teichoic acid export membrane protein